MSNRNDGFYWVLFDDEKIKEKEHPRPCANKTTPIILSGIAHRSSQWIFSPRKRNAINDVHTTFVLAALASPIGKRAYASYISAIETKP